MANITIIEALNRSLAATKKYVDDKLAEANASGGYTHPDSHPASMITGLATVATSGSYNDLNDKPTIPDVSDKANISGQVFTGTVEAPIVKATSYFFTPALINEGNLTSYYHRLNLGYANHDYWEFHEYGGDYRFYKNTAGTDAGKSLIANITSTGSNFVGQLKEGGVRVYSPNNKPTAADLGITIPSIDGLATETYVNNKVAGLVDSAPEALNTLNELATALGNDANFATTIATQIGTKVDKVEGKVLSTNDLTNELKANYDAAYTHSIASHAPANAQKNSDILKSEIEAKLTGDITSHTHSQYLTSVPAEYITETELTDKGYAPLNSPDFTGDVSMGRKADSTVGPNSVALGIDATASGDISHAEGINTIASGEASHAEGYLTTASGDYSHAEGGSTTASGVMSHAEGGGTIASSEIQHVQGKFNIEDTENKYAHIVGNGEYNYNTNEEVRSNAHTLDWSGNAWFAGKVTVSTAPTENMDVATKQYVDDNTFNGDYNNLTNKPITILTAAENEFIILSELAVGAYLITGTFKYMSTDTVPRSFNNSFVEVFKFGSLTFVADPFYITAIDSSDNSMESVPRANMQADWNVVDTKDPSYINNKPTIPTVTNDLTNALKSNYDTAYTHSQSAHAPSNAQKNSDITKAEIEAKLIGDVTTHTHSQYLTEHQSLTGYATEEFVNNRLSSLQIVPITQADYDALATKDPNTLYLITTTNAGSIDSNNHITLSSDLPSGRYTLKYEDENGQPLSDFEDITTMEV